MKFLAIALVFLLEGCACMHQGEKSDEISVAVNSPHRIAKNVARDRYRHPVETLRFFGVKPEMKILELWPSGDGYYTEIIGKLSLGKGEYLAALFGFGDDTSTTSQKYKDYGEKYKEENDRFVERIQSRPRSYDPVRIFYLGLPGEVFIGNDEYLDMILTFRNFHNWYGEGEEAVTGLIKAAYLALKPGGIFGIVDHRAKEGASFDKESGYMPEQTVIDLMEKNGFKLVGKSDVNNNPKDTKEYERGVWTLPPRMALGDQEVEKYLEIGESDRFTLKFMKPM